MAWKIRDDFRDNERIDPKIGVGPPKSTLLLRQVDVLPDGTPRYGDGRIFLAGSPVPDEYVLPDLVQSYRDGDAAVCAMLELVGDSNGSDAYKDLSSDELDVELAKRDLTPAGTGAGGNVTKKDKVAALQADDVSQRATVKTASGAPAVTAPLGPNNPFVAT